MTYLLDTNVVIGLIIARPSLIRRAKTHRMGSLAVSSIVRFELFFRAYRSKRTQQNLEAMLSLAFNVLDFDDNDARQAAEIRASLESAGTPIGPYDTLIAGQARARDLILVTRNLGEFARVDGLRLENWEA